MNSSRHLNKMQSLRDSSISQIKPVPGLFISDRFAARSLSLLNSLNIKHILSVTQSEDTPKFSSEEANSSNTAPSIIQKHIDIYDDPTEDLICHLKDACDWIEAGLRSAMEETDAVEEKPIGVLVHCTQGISRSGSIIVACLMRTLSVSYPAALALARESRPLITPNPGFEYQLRIWEECKYDVFTTDLVSGMKQEKAQYRTLKANRKALVGRGEEAVNRVRFASMAKVAADFGKRRGKVEVTEEERGDGGESSEAGGGLKGKGWEDVERMEREWTQRLISGERPPWKNDEPNTEHGGVSKAP